MRHRAAFRVARFVKIDHVAEDAVLVRDSFREAAVLAATASVARTEGAMIRTRESEGVSLGAASISKTTSEIG